MEQSVFFRGEGKLNSYSGELFYNNCLTDLLNHEIRGKFRQLFVFVKCFTFYFLDRNKVQIRFFTFTFQFHIEIRGKTNLDF